MDHKEYLSRIGARGGKRRGEKLSKARLREIALKGVWAREQIKNFVASQVVDSPSALRK